MVKFKQYINEGLPSQQDYLDDKLVQASKKNDLNAIKAVLDNGADIDCYDGRPVISAAYNGHLEIVKYMVERGADVHVHNDEALQWAVENNEVKVAKYLIEKGCKVSNLDETNIKKLISKLDPQYVIKNIPQYSKYIVDPNYSHAALGGKFGAFDEEN